MTSYGDILNTENNILYHTKYAPFCSKAKSINAEPNGSIKQYNYVFKAAPAKGQSINQSYYQEHGKQEWKSKSEFSFKHDDLKLKLMTSNYKYSLHAFFPILKDDWKVNADCALYHQPGAERKAEVNASIESPNISGCDFAVDLHWSQLQKRTKNADKDGKETVEWSSKTEDKAEMEVEIDATCTYEKDIFAGVTVDLQEGKYQAAEATLARLDGKNKQWLGCSTSEKNKQVKVGCKTHNDQHNFDHVYELRYNLNEITEKNKEASQKFFGLPCVFTFGGKYVLNSKSSFTYSAEWSKNVHAFLKWQHKIDNNWNFGVSQSMDQSKDTKDMYKLSFDVSYNL